jgi:hypothetical protein
MALGALLINGLGCPAQWPWVPCSMALGALLNGLGCPAHQWPWVPCSMALGALAVKMFPSNAFSIGGALFSTKWPHAVNDQI